jgi:hypothetical protein
LLCEEHLGGFLPDISSDEKPADSFQEKMKKNGVDFRIKRGPMSREKKGSQSSKLGLINITSQDLARVLKPKAVLDSRQSGKLLYRTLYQNEIDDLYCIDTEFGRGHNGSIWLCEIADLNSKGFRTSNTTNRLRLYDSGAT